MKFHRTFTGSLSSGAGTVGIAPDTLGSRMVALSDTYNFYRIEKLEYRLHPNGTRTALQGAGFYPGVLDTAPANITDLSESPHTQLLGTSATVPTSWSKLSWRSLESYFPWYKTKAGSLDPSEEQQGTFYFIGGSTDPYSLEVSGVMAFRTPVNTGSTPALREQQMMLRERERLLKILSCVPMSSIGSPNVLCRQVTPGSG